MHHWNYDLTSNIFWPKSPIVWTILVWSDKMSKHYSFLKTIYYRWGWCSLNKYINIWSLCPRFQHWICIHTHITSTNCLHHLWYKLLIKLLPTCLVVCTCKMTLPPYITSDHVRKINIWCTPDHCIKNSYMVWIISYIVPHGLTLYLVQDFCNFLEFDYIEIETAV